MKKAKKKEEARSVGRPKLADTKLKRNSLIISGVCLLVVIALLLVGAAKFNLFRLRGDVSDRLEKGDRFCLGTECFYTINDDGTTVTALAQYNLLVGYNIEFDLENREIVGEPEEIDPDTTEGYGLQNSEAFGADRYRLSEWKAVDKFASDNYWGYDGRILDSYGGEEFSYVYDEFSDLYKYLEGDGDSRGYKGVLDEITGGNVTVRLMTQEDVAYLACVDEEQSECDEDYAPQWAKSTNYWTGMAHDDDRVYFLDYDDQDFDYGDVDYSGVRPVIELPKSLIPEDRGLKYKEYKIGQTVCLKENDEECFYVLGQDDETLTLFAVENLLVGNHVFGALNQDTGEITISSEEEIPTDTEGYGWQIKGEYPVASMTSTEAYAAVPFINSYDGETPYYWVTQGDEGLEFKEKYKYISEVQPDEMGYVYDAEEPTNEIAKYVNAYADRIKTLLDAEEVTGRLLNVDDYYQLYMAYYMAGNEAGVISSLFNTTFWTGLVESPDDYGIMTFMRADNPDEGLGKLPPYMSLGGVRPVITVNKIDLEPEKKQQQQNDDNNGSENNGSDNNGGSDNSGSNNGGSDNSGSNNNGSNNSGSNNTVATTPKASTGSGASTSSKKNGTISTGSSIKSIGSSSSSSSTGDGKDADSKDGTKALVSKIVATNTSKKANTKIILAIIAAEVLLIAVLLVNKFRKKGKK